MAFTIGKRETSIEKVAFENFDIGLLAKGEGMEVMIQSILKDNIFYIYPAENHKVSEIVFILKGEILCENNGEKIKLGPHDYFTANNLETPIHFTALTDVEYLWVINEPTFYQLSESIKELTKMVEKVEARDPYTYNHNERVARYSIKIAKKLSLSKMHLERLYISAILHDIGKINIPTEVLNKPSRLTKEEFDLIKKHPEDGAEMVKELYYDDSIAKIIEQHHERLNGVGYPKGLVGDEILLEARIIAVSDTFDAMTEDRAYRKAFTPEFAVEELKKLSPSQYDEDVVNALIEILEEEGKLKKTAQAHE